MVIRPAARYAAAERTVSARTKDRDRSDDESVLPPGQRDPSGFWFPAAYADPSTMARRRRRLGTPAENDEPDREPV
jgi:hypothetical protein